MQTTMDRLIESRRAESPAEAEARRQSYLADKKARRAAPGSCKPPRAEPYVLVLQCDQGEEPKEIHFSELSQAERRELLAIRDSYGAEPPEESSIFDLTEEES